MMRVRLRDWIVEEAGACFERDPNGFRTLDEWIASRIDQQLSRVEADQIEGACRVEPRLEPVGEPDRTPVEVPDDLCGRVQGAYGLVSTPAPSALVWMDTLLWQAVDEAG